LGFRVEVEVAMKQKAAFQTFTDEVSLALHRLGLEFEPGPSGLVRQQGKEVGRVISWQPGKGALILWHPVDWESSVETKIEFKFRATKGGTRITVEHSGLKRVLGSEEAELLGWFADRMVAHLLSSSTPSRLGDWITDRKARRPTGSAARVAYRNPTHHRPNFKAILEKLRLSENDRLLEIGCGGGAFLKDALKSGCRAAAVDHSPEMVRLAKRVNAAAVREGHLDVRESEADSLPFEDSTFTCAVMTSVLGFLPDAVKVFTEIKRVLAPGGRMIVFSTSKEAKGTIAAPEPMASRIHFYEDAELERMALEAGFSETHLEHPDLSRFLRGSGIPKRDLEPLSGRFDQLLLAKNSKA